MEVMLLEKHDCAGNPIPVETANLVPFWLDNQAWMVVGAIDYLSLAPIIVVHSRRLLPPRRTRSKGPRRGYRLRLRNFK
jgi:hypothetical protein